MLFDIKRIPFILQAPLCKQATLTPGSPRGLVDVWIEKSLGEEARWMTEDHVQGLLIDVLTGGTFKFVICATLLTLLVVLISFH